MHPTWTIYSTCTFKSHEAIENIPPEIKIRALEHESYAQQFLNFACAKLYTAAHIENHYNQFESLVPEIKTLKLPWNQLSVTL